MTEFLHLNFASAHNRRLFTVSDSDGYLTVISKNFHAKTRINTANVIKQMISIHGKLAIVQQDSVAFSSGIDGKISPGFCESGMKSLTSGE